MPIQRKKKATKRRNPCLPCNPSTRATRFSRMKRNPDENEILVFGINWEYDITFSRTYVKSSLPSLKRKLENDASMKFDQIFVINTNFDIEIYPDF